MVYLYVCADCDVQGCGAEEPHWNPKFGGEGVNRGVHAAG